MPPDRQIDRQTDRPTDTHLLTCTHTHTLSLLHKTYQVAMGVGLHRIPDIRRLYGLDALGDSPIDFDTGECVCF